MSFKDVLSIAIVLFALVYAGVGILSTWILETRSPGHPKRNNLISAFIPFFLMIVLGLMIDFPKHGWTTQWSAQGAAFSLIVKFGFILFVFVGIPVCSIYRRKLAKANHSKENNPEENN